MSKKYQRLKKASNTYIYIILTIFLISSLLIGINIYIIHSSYIKVGNISISYPEYQFFYTLTINKMKSDYSDYIEYMDIDFSKDLAEQQLGDSTWEEYFITQTDMSIYKILALCNEAENNNFKYNLDEDVNSFIEEQKSYAESIGFSYKEYIKMTYDKNITEKMIRNCMKYYFLSNLYSLECNINEITDEMYEEYYASHKDELDTVDYGLISVPIENKNQLESIIGEIKTVDDFEEKSIEIQKSDGFFSVEGYSNCSSLYNVWLFNANPGEMKIFCDDNYAYLIYHIERHRNNSKTKNVCYAKVDSSDETSYQNILEIKDKFELSKKTEENFIKLVNEYNIEDSGFIENLTTSDCYDLIEVWLFDETRKPGDTQLFKDENSCYYIFYINDGIEAYKSLSKYSLQEEIIKNYIDSILKKYEFLKK